jgi:fructoselysine 3-epimerase
MRLCSVTSLMKFYPLPEALAVIAEAGYQGVELWGGLPHAYTDDFYDGGKLDQATVDRCRKLLNDSGLEPVSFLPEQCFYPVNFLIDDAPPFDGAKLRERSLAYFERAIDLTAALGIPRMLVTTPFWGWARHGEHFHYGAGKALPRVVESFGRLTRRAEQRGVTLVLEPLTFLETTAVETLDDLAAVLDGIGSNALVAMLDTGHINVTARSLGLDPIEYLQAHIDRLGPRLQHLHLDDNHGDLDAHLLPGEGNFDFAAAYAALQRAGYTGWLSAELMMFGANPVPPTPLDLLRRTREHTLWAWNRN